MNALGTAAQTPQVGENSLKGKIASPEAPKASAAGETFTPGASNGAEADPTAALKDMSKNSTAKKKVNWARATFKAIKGAAAGAVAGVLGGVAGGLIGGVFGFIAGAGTGWKAGAKMAMKIAERTGQGKNNEILGGIGSLTTPFLCAAAGMAVGTTAGAALGAFGLPVIGAIFGGAAAMSSEFV